MAIAYDDEIPIDPGPPPEFELTSRKAPQKFDEQAREKFLAFLRRYGLFYRAATYAGCSHETTRLYRKEHPEFEALVQEAVEAFRNSLEAELFDRAVRGWEEPVYQKGELVGTIHKRDSQLLQMLVKGNLQSKYRENVKVDATVSGGVLVVPSGVSLEDWERQFGPEANAKETDNG